MQKNKKSKLKLIHNNKNTTINKVSLLRNNEIENLIISAAKLSNNSEVKVYFKNIPASEYTLGYKKFCGIKINDLTFYNPSLFDLYPKIMDFLYFNHKETFEKMISLNKLDDKYFSYNENSFDTSHHIMDSNLYLNLNISFDEILKILDEIIEFIYERKILKVLTVSSVKN